MSGSDAPAGRPKPLEVSDVLNGLPAAGRGRLDGQRRCNYRIDACSTFPKCAILPDGTEMDGTARSVSRALTGLLVLCSIVGLSAFLFSPWHQHARFSSTPCAFSTFEHSACEDVAGCVAAVDPSPQWFWLSVAPPPAPGGLVAKREAPVRAPPFA